MRLLLAALCVLLSRAGLTTFSSEASLLSSAPASPFYPAGAVARLHAELAAQQAPADCASARALVLVFGEESGINGFAAMFQFAAAALAVARALNRTLLEALPPPPPPGGRGGGGGGGGDAWPRAPPRYCGGAKLGCFFEPLSRCGAVGWELAALPEVAPSLGAALAQAAAPALRLSRLGPAHGLLFEATRGRAGGGTAPWWAAAVGPHGCVYEGGRRDGGACAARLWFPAVEAFLFRPLPRLRAAVGAAVAAMAAAAAGSAGVGALALHVRRGDAAALPWRANASLPHYLAVARLGLRGAAGAAGGAPTPLYVATDSAEVKAAVGALAAPAFQLLPSPARVLVAPGGDAGVHTETFIAASLAGSAAAGAGAGAGAPPPPPPPPPPRPLPAVPVALDAPAAAPPAPAAAARRGGAAAFLAAAAAAGEGAAAARAEADVAALTEGVVADVWALSHGTHFVGTCLSQVSRLAYEVAYGAGRARAPPVGVDALACRAHARHFMAIAADWRESFDTWEDA
jgi:hypothetical protein